ncbi:TauD/TfdA family dioxygenase [Xenorhabdus bharatensis]|uniref:TauD/TfdA family dioxygenase n=1 Tax=Xenorhabdus bharatensis TaxID=3136256 RepID=UPI0030F3FF9A
MDNNKLYNLSMELLKNKNKSVEFSMNKNELHDNDYFVSNIEIDEFLPETPTETGYIEEKEIKKSILSLIKFNIELGLYPVVYQGENDGRLIRNVAPKKSAKNQVSSHGYFHDFFPHVDNPDLMINGDSLKNTPCPDTLSLLCLKKEDNVFTSIIRLDDVLTDLSQKDINLLKEHNYIVKRPDSFEGSSQMVENLPLINEYNGKYYSRFDYHNVLSEKKENNDALEKLRKSSMDKNKWIELSLNPGQVVIFNNQRTLHTRNAFQPRFDGNDRWLLRLFALYQKPEESYLLSQECNHHLKVTG